jgi:hypothetical protein
MALDPEGQAVKKEVKEEAKTEGKVGEKAIPESEDTIELLKKRPPLDPVSFHVYLIEKTQGILGGQHWDLKFPVGGGYLDYRYFLPEVVHSGTFLLKIKFDQPMDPKDTHIYYLSNAQVRNIDEKPIGNGCHRYFDISEYWRKTINTEGLILNTNQNRHISLTAGTFYFVSPVQGKLRIAHLTVKDSRHHDYCF